MKKLLLLLPLIVLSSCVSKKEYNEKLEQTTLLMFEVAGYSDVITNGYIQVWHEAIYDNRYNGKYCSDFNEALSDFQERMKNETDVYKLLNDKKKELDNIVSELKDYPSSYKVKLCAETPHRSFLIRA